VVRATSQEISICQKKKKRRCNSLPSLQLVWIMLATRRCIIPSHANPENPHPLGSWPLKIELLRTTRVPPNISQIEDKEIYYAKIIETHGVPFPCYVGPSNYRDVLAAVNTEYKRGSYVRILFSRKKSRQTLQRSITAPKSHLLAPGSNE